MRLIKGLSLLEILISLIIGSIIIILSASSIAHYFDHRKHYIYMQQLYHDLKWARMEAVALNIPVAIQPYDSATNSVETDWCDGWAVYKNPHKKNLLDAAQIVKIHDGIKDCSITFSSSLSYAYFQFLPQGMTDYQDGSFSFYENSVVTMRIIINQTGRVRWVSE